MVIPPQILQVQKREPVGRPRKDQAQCRLVALSPQHLPVTGPKLRWSHAPNPDAIGTQRQELHRSRRHPSHRCLSHGRSWRPPRGPPDKSPFTSAISTATPAALRSCSAISCASCSGSGGPRRTTAPADGGQRNANLRARVGFAVDDDGANCRAWPSTVIRRDGCAGLGYPPAADCAQLITPRPGRQPRRLACAHTLSAVQDELVWIDLDDRARSAWTS